MHKAYTELSLALVQACRELVDQYGTPDSVHSPHTHVKVAGDRCWISSPQVTLNWIGRNQWQVTSQPDSAPGAASMEDLQEGERIVSELAVLAANGAWLTKANGSIRRLKAILRALNVA